MLKILSCSGRCRCKRRHKIGLIVLSLLTISQPVYGIGFGRAKEPLPHLVAPMTKIEEGAVQPNEAGQIMVLMYHGLDKHKQSKPYMRTIAGFKSDLQQLYEHGFRPISVADLVNNNIQVEAGCTPVVITFDDGMDTSFALEERDGAYVPVLDCAVDIMDKFALEHPDFGKAAVFFINGGDRPPFAGAGTVEERLQYLVNHGYELGNHTYTHIDMSKAGAYELQKEMASVERLVRECVPGYNMVCMAYPYGVRPAAGLRKYALQGENDGIAYHYALAFRASVTPTPANPNCSGLDPLNMPRVRGTDSSETDLGWQLKRYAENPDLRYISDGDPDIITVPFSELRKIDTAALGSRTLNIYGLQLDEMAGDTAKQ